ncbi:hypothetical protein SISNIDRAFT_487590 [Sistotremastrum niveocremeum HHB9708]|uniref:Uncharacterized protein n=1 Tax=Sistotremastrum niveocremeum HHB9708 TaxID=1314777 RepID=A0A164S9F4_9AGAM|nr:hypothetical protein SISNIDRAFT_487590 [Sistotremastrum niveocremeum HHB9708]
MAMDEGSKFLTPPLSAPGTPLNIQTQLADEDSDSSRIQISTTFFPGADLPIHGIRGDPCAPLSNTPDIVLLSSDSVFFYVHSLVLTPNSSNAFNHLLPFSRPRIAPQQTDYCLAPNTPISDMTTPPRSDSDFSIADVAEVRVGDSMHVDAQEATIVPLSETSGAINILLHTVYAMDCSFYAPSFDDLASAVAAVSKYGFLHLLNPTRSSPTSPLSSTLAPPPSSTLPPVIQLILSYAPSRPLDVYTLAARYHLHDLAVSCSPHLLSLALPVLTDEIAQEMGPVYLKRLFFLHLGRVDALKRLLLPPPHPHAPTPTCDFTEQKKLTRAWALASSYLVWDARPDMSVGALESALAPLGEHLWCDQCRDALRVRIQDLVVQWSSVKVGHWVLSLYSSI